MHGNSKYTPELAAKICLLVGEGYSLKKIGAMDGMPSDVTILNWCNGLGIDENIDFLSQYMRAKEDYAEHIAEEILQIADETSNDYIEDKTAPTGYKLNGEAIQRSRLRIDTRKWLAGKLKPKRYGDKALVENGGSVSIIVNKNVDEN